MRIDVLLADAAQAVQGKLYILGGGWTDTPLNADGHTLPHALAVLVHVPWDQADRSHRLVAKLLDDASRGVQVADLDRVEIVMDFEVSHPPDATPGSALPVPFAANVGPLPLQPGRYTWDLCVDGEPLQQADVSFTVHAAPGTPTGE